MKRAFRIPDDTRYDQARAADPESSVWVSANAGSGKTHVLSQRVVRLLLRGADPAKILCLTYTRAAAANMSNRVFKTLADWTVLGDKALAEAIADLEGEAPSRSKLADARRLFARALETPGGLKIQTIHAFCESVLHQFPLEANIAAHFELLDPAMETALVDAVRREMLTGVAVGDDRRLAESFAKVLDCGGDHGLEKLLTEIVAKRDMLRRFIGAMSGDSLPYATLYEVLEFTPGETSLSIAQANWPLPSFSPEFFRVFVDAVAVTDAGSAAKNILPGAIAAFEETDPVRRFRFLAEGFLKGDGGAYAPSVFKKALVARLPDVYARYEQAAAVVAATSEKLARMSMLEATCAALDIADWMIGRYERIKSARGLLDFNDLIVRTHNLLKRTDAGQWVHYKLDKGIDHILLDEAQDTSPDQWEVVKRLAEEFFSGHGARSARRTVFAVGDEKQSIYSFQGAAPNSFAETKQHFSARVRGAKGRFEDVRLNWSFRSTFDVLSAVDVVFRDQTNRRGLTRDSIELEHRAIRELAPGYVEVWPSLGVTQVEEPDDWRVSIDHAKAPEALLAETIASKIQSWIRHGEVIEGTGKRLTAGDVLVLVRKRDRFMHALSRSLKNRDVPVAGADRLSLPGHIAVKDLIALGRFVLQPEDDLSLAAVLRSPIFDVSETMLFRLAHGRAHGVSLDMSMRGVAADDAGIASIVAKLDGWRNEAAFKPPFDFYAAILGRDSIRRRMIGRLGHEAGEILDEFLNFCLAEERTGLPGLEAFLATLEQSSFEVKREMDQTRDEVRIMTVHASKGLEAPVVFLVDSGSASFTYQHLPSLLPFEIPGDFEAVKGCLWYPGKEFKNDVSKRVIGSVIQAADDEYRRLLYVGMTRAEDRLIVCGFHGSRPPGPSTWHSMVTNTLKASEGTVELEHLPGQPAFRYRVTPEQAVTPEPRTVQQPSELPLLPGGLFEPLPRDEKLPRPLSPSGASLLLEPQPGDGDGGKRASILDPDKADNISIARGIAAHKLLQALPGTPAAEWRRAASAYLDRVASDWPAGEADAVLKSVLDILQSEQFAPIFAAGSRPEVAIMGALQVRGKERAVSGVIDRLAVTDEEVLIIDYKTNRLPPDALAQVPEPYVLQLAIYAALLKPLYPGRKVSVGLLFTEAPRLMSLPAAELERALARLTAS